MQMPTPAGDAGPYGRAQMSPFGRRKGKSCRRLACRPERRISRAACLVCVIVRGRRRDLACGVVLAGAAITVVKISRGTSGGGMRPALGGQLLRPTPHHMTVGLAASRSDAGR